MYPKPRLSLSTVKGNNSVLHSPFPPDIWLKLVQYLFLLSRRMVYLFAKLKCDAKKPTINTALMITCETLTCQNESRHRPNHPCVASYEDVR